MFRSIVTLILVPMFFLAGAGYLIKKEKKF